jgi:hypothetical protein
LYFNAKYNVITTKTGYSFNINLHFHYYIFSKKLTIKGYSIEKLVHKINEIPRNPSKNIVLGFVAISFSHQYYFFVSRFDVDLPYLTLMAAVTSVYFLASSLPTFQFYFAVKAVSPYFLWHTGRKWSGSSFCIDADVVLNIVLPVVIGCADFLKPSKRHGPFNNYYGYNFISWLLVPLI